MSTTPIHHGIQNVRIQFMLLKFSLHNFMDMIMSLKCLFIFNSEVSSFECSSLWCTADPHSLHVVYIIPKTVPSALTVALITPLTFNMYV